MSAAKLVRRRVGDVAFKAFCIGVTVLALAALAAILWSLLSQGIGGLNLDVFTKRTMSTGSHGGLANAIVGSLEMCLLAMIIALTVGILAGTWLAEYGGRSAYGAVVRFLNDVLLSAPPAARRRTGRPG
jgi:phosphate transport system permease protein